MMMKELSSFLPVKEFVAVRGTCLQASGADAFNKLLHLERIEVLKRKFRSGLHTDDSGTPLGPEELRQVRKNLGPPKSAEHLFDDQAWLWGPVIRRAGVWGDWGLGLEYSYEVTGSSMDGCPELWDQYSKEVMQRTMQDMRPANRRALRDFGHLLRSQFSGW